MSELTRAKVPPPNKPTHDWAAFVEWCRVTGRKVNIDSLISYREQEGDGNLRMNGPEGKGD